MIDFREYKNYFKVFLLVLLLLSQTIKVFDIKFIEFVGFIGLMYYFKKLNRVENLILIFFFIFFLITIARNQFFTFPEFTYHNPLKDPYIITFSRFIEYASCIGIAVLVRIEFSKYDISLHPRLVEIFIIFNVISICFMLIFYILEVFGLNFMNLSYGSNYRFKGFFFEGGPWGLYNAFLIGVVYFCNVSKKYLISALFFVVIILARSKAGFVAVSLLLLLALFQQYRYKLSFVSFKWIFTLSILLPLFSIFFYYMSSIYLDYILNKEYLKLVISNDPTHYWVIGGRVPGFFIIKEMVSANPLFGIGMGNYQLLRNSTEFLNIFPVTFLWDYHGFGGLVDLIVEFGIIGFFIFIGILLYAFRSKSIFYGLLFIIPFSLGLPLYFHYPWILFGFIDKR